MDRNSTDRNVTSRPQHVMDGVGAGANRTAPRSTRRRRRLAGTAVASIAIVASLTLASCSDSDSEAVKAKDTATTQSTGESTTTASTAAPTPEKIEVTAKDYSFEGIPETMAVGSSLGLKNSSAKEVHEIVVFRLPDTEKRSGKELAKLPMADLQKALAGPPTMVIVAPPTQPGFVAVGDGTLSQPGRYLAICAVPTGADPSAYMSAAAQSKGGPVNVPGGPPHMAEGMWAEFTVQ